MTAFSRSDLNIDQDRNDETRIVENFENGDFPALRPNYDGQAHAHHNCVFPMIPVFVFNTVFQELHPNPLEILTSMSKMSSFAVAIFVIRELALNFIGRFHL